MIFVLIHGAWHDSRCWQRVTPLLEAAGNEVIALDLPGHGTNLQNPKEIHLATYIDLVCHEIEKINAPIVLVGHSFAGIIMSTVALRIPTQIKRLVYIAAFVPKNKESLFRIAETFPPTPLTLIRDETQKIIALDYDKAVEKLCQDGTTADKAFLKSILQPEPMLPMREPVLLSSDPCTLIPSDYIACTDDITMPIACQKAMIQDRQFRLIELSSGHSPFVTVPEVLVRALIE